MVKEAAEKIGIQKYTETARGRKRALVHPHVGRVYFKTQTRKANVDPDLRNFMMGHQMPFEGAYDKFVDEVAPAMEQARTRLALIPQSVSKLEQRKRSIIDAIKLARSREELAKYEKLIGFATTDEELDLIVDNLKNGRTELEHVRR